MLDFGGRDLKGQGGVHGADPERGRSDWEPEFSETNRGRVGGRYSDDWHRAHMLNPRDVVPESIMPGYPWLQENELDASLIQDKMRALNLVGHGYTEEQIAAAPGEAPSTPD